MVSQFLVRYWYGCVTRLDRGLDLRVMNYGFDNGVEIAVDAEDQSSSYRLQLYHHVIGSVDVRGKDVLEVGSGRGGGASYLTRVFRPRAYLGLDFCESAVVFCQRHYTDPGLSFKQGDAQCIPLSDGLFDIVLNVESSHTYPDVAGFFREAHRVLRPGGHFLFADFRPSADAARVPRLMEDAGFRILSADDITAGVLRSLDHDDAAKQHIIDSSVPLLIRPLFRRFAGMKGTIMYDKFARRELRYAHVVAQRAD